MQRYALLLSRVFLVRLYKVCDTSQIIQAALTRNRLEVSCAKVVAAESKVADVGLGWLEDANRTGGRVDPGACVIRGSDEVVDNAACVSLSVIVPSMTIAGVLWIEVIANVVLSLPDPTVTGFPGTSVVLSNTKLPLDACVKAKPSSLTADVPLDIVNIVSVSVLPRANRVVDPRVNML